MGEKMTSALLAIVGGHPSIVSKNLDQGHSRVASQWVRRLLLLPSTFRVPNPEKNLVDASWYRK